MQFKVGLSSFLSTHVMCYLISQNLSQQSDVADLLGGFRPMDPQYICVPLYKELEILFSDTFSVKVLVYAWFIFKSIC